MPAKRPKKLIPLTAFAPVIEQRDNTLSDIQKSIEKIESNYSVEIAKIQSNYALFDEDYFHTYTRYENDFKSALAYVDEEYRLLFDALNNDVTETNNGENRTIKQENDVYQSIVSNFMSLEEQAYNKYYELCKASEAYIDRESSIHKKFVDEEDARFESIKRDYAGINNKQYDTLLWSMEKSKNALSDLSRNLNEQAFNDSKFLTASITKTLENLRDTKNKITVLFKTTTQIFAQKKKIIDDLSLVRQKPHSVLNQKLINQFVQQIDEVNEQKTSFDSLVKADLERSTKIIGQKIIESDAANNQKLTKKLIMQYQIVKAKADFLLKRNQQMSDLLISKYQNEIKKIKIDSFRRVEEIKLAYYMPSEFFQNSITIYSNFAFYINESMDEIDNLLSDFIRFNQNITQTAADYIHTSSKIFEDYKINLLVTVNDATNKLTELITNVDHISKEIIALESKNRLEVAEVRKEMENADITGDYNKYLKTLEFDRFFADYQHNINLQKITADNEKNRQLLTIQNDLTKANKDRQINEIAHKQAKLLNGLERQIHESALDKEFMLSEALHRKNLELLEANRKMEIAQVEFKANRNAYLYGMAMQSEDEKYEQTRSEGNKYVVDFVHETQELIDLHKTQTNVAKDYVSMESDPLRYARILENERRILIHNLNQKLDNETEPYRNAIGFYNHLLFITQKHLFQRVTKFESIFIHLLIGLRTETILVQAKGLIATSVYLYDMTELITSSKDTLIQILTTCEMPEYHLEVENRFEKEIYDFHQKSISLNKRLKKLTNKKALSVSMQTFYIESILQMRKLVQYLTNLFDRVLEKSIENDVLIIEKYREKELQDQEIVNLEYEKRIYISARKNQSNHHILSQLDHEYSNFELIMKERVYQLNQTFLNVLSKEQEKVQFIKQELLQEISKIEKINATDLETVDANIQSKIAEAKARFNEFENKYKSVKSNLYSNIANENVQKDIALKTNEVERNTYLETLNQSIVKLPNYENTLLAQLEQEKAALLDQKRAILNKELAEIEEQKFLATPVYLDKIEAIKDRLPSDYVQLYKEIANAESQLIKEHRAIEEIYNQNFGRFIGNQMEYNSLLFNDALILHPFEKNLSSTKKIVEKSNELFKDTIDKSAITQAKMSKKLIESDEKQKRVLNV